MIIDVNACLFVVEANFTEFDKSTATLTWGKAKHSRAYISVRLPTLHLFILM